MIKLRTILATLVAILAVFFLGTSAYAATPLCPPGTALGDSSTQTDSLWGVLSSGTFSGSLPFPPVPTGANNTIYYMSFPVGTTATEACNLTNLGDYAFTSMDGTLGTSTSGTFDFSGNPITLPNSQMYVLVYEPTLTADATPIPGSSAASTSSGSGTTDLGGSFIPDLQAFFLNRVAVNGLGLMLIVVCIGVLVTWGRKAAKAK